MSIDYQAAEAKESKQKYPDFERWFLPLPRNRLFRLFGSSPLSSPFLHRCSTEQEKVAEVGQRILRKGKEKGKKKIIK